MTDKQILDIVLKRAEKVHKTLVNPKIVITQQYGKKLYFSVKFGNEVYPHPLAFSNHGKTMVFMLPELPDRLMEWKRNVINRLMAMARDEYVEFDIESMPKEIVHIFSNAIISALNTDGMGIHIMASGLPVLFAPNETYETVQVEVDLMEFEYDE